MEWESWREKMEMSGSAVGGAGQGHFYIASLNPQHFAAAVVPLRKEKVQQGKHEEPFGPPVLVF